MNDQRPLTTAPLAVIETHPIQYHAPVYRAVQRAFGIPVTVVYGSDFSVAGYRDRGFGTTFAWDSDLLSGYTSVFLSKVSQGGARSDVEVTTRGLGAALQRIAPSAVMVVGYSPRFHREAFLQARRGGSPILFRGETTDHAVQRAPVKSWARDRALEWFYQRCDRLLYIGDHSHRHYRRLRCPETKLFFSPYCVDTQPFQCDEQARSVLRSSVRSSLNIGKHQKVLLFSGKLRKRRGPGLLLRAVKEMPPEIRDHIVVLFLGDGDLRESLGQLAREAPAVKTHFLGFQNQSQLSRYYHAADLLVLPSLQKETWGLVVNEALHHGLPCAVSAGVGCAPDLIEPGVTGEIFETGSAHGLALMLRQALNLTGRKDIRRACRHKVSGYTVEKAAEGIATAYSTLVHGRDAVKRCA